MSGASDPRHPVTPMPGYPLVHVGVPQENDVASITHEHPCLVQIPNLDGGFDANFDDMPGIEGETAGNSDGIPRAGLMGECSRVEMIHGGFGAVT